MINDHWLLKIEGMMFRKNFKIALRNITKHKTIALINITGLAIGITCCILVLLFINHETSYDDFHEKGSRIYRLTMNTDSKNSSGFGRMPYPLGPKLAESLPEIQEFVRWKNYRGVVKTENTIFNQQLLFADANFFKMFTFPLLEGNPETALNDPNSIVITEKMAYKLFGNESALGKILAFTIEKEFHDVTVRGVAKDVPDNSSIQFDVIVPIPKLNDFGERNQLSEWATLGTETYILLCENVSLIDFKMKLEESKQTLDELSHFQDLSLQPINAIHYSGISTFVSPLGKLSYSYILGGIALAVLIIACINFILITLTTYTDRSKEIGIRKTIGANKKQLTLQFLVETLIYVSIAFLLGLLLTGMFLPIFNEFIQRHIQIESSFQIVPIVSSVVLLFLVVFIAGGYPAFYLSRLDTIPILQNKQRFGRHHFLSRVLIIVQFGFTIFFITFMIFMSQQMNYMQNKNLGFNPNQILVIPTGADYKTAEYSQRVLSRLQKSLQSVPAVQSVSGTFFNGGISDKSIVQKVKQKEKMIEIGFKRVSSEFIETLDIKMISGESLRHVPKLNKERFIEHYRAGIPFPVIVNEALVEAFGWDNPIGQILQVDYYDYYANVIGVVENYHFESLHQALKPMMMIDIQMYPISDIYIKCSTQNMQHTLKVVEKKWKEIATDLPFEPQFLDETVQKFYEAEQRWGRIIRFSSIITLFISCLGLFGLVALSCMNRTKEIGIRKVLGSSVSGILELLTKDFTKWILLANLIAWPIAWYAINKWLQNFAYHIDLTIWPFLLAGLSTLVIALLTVSWQAIRAATANPVESLRYE